MKQIYFFLIFILSSTSLKGENNLDSLVLRFNNYSYATISNTTDTSFITKKRDYFFNFLKSLSKEIKYKNSRKDLNFIFERIHAEFFKIYEENPEFMDIFLTGKYNCVTATAIYSIVFDYFKISYEIKELPTHVYLIAYPRDLNIIVESTLPINGLIDYSPKELAKYKEFLISRKIVGKSEANEMNFFNKHISPDSTISASKLNGIQYYNIALKLYNMRQYDKALNMIAKTKSLYDDENVKNLFDALFLELLKEDEYFSDVKNKCKLFQFYLNFMGSKGNVELATREYIINSVKDQKTKDAAFLNSYKACLTESLSDTIARNESMRLINILLAQYYSSQSNVDTSLYYLEISYDTSKIETFNFINFVVGQKYKESQECDTIIQIVQKYEEIFPHTKKEKMFRAVKVAGFMKIVFQEFELNNPIIGDQALKEFKAIFKPNDGNIYFSDAIGTGFGAASSYQVRQNNYLKAKEILMEGLQYSPSSVELRRKLSLIEKR